MLNNPANGIVTGTSLTTGGVVIYVCNVGFELVGDVTRDCQSNSKWSGEPPICRRRFIIPHCSCVCTCSSHEKLYLLYLGVTVLVPFSIFFKHIFLEDCQVLIHLTL